jgi:hypothetical protein
MSALNPTPCRRSFLVYPIETVLMAFLRMVSKLYLSKINQVDNLVLLCLIVHTQVSSLIFLIVN